MKLVVICIKTSFLGKKECVFSQGRVGGAGEDSGNIKGNATTESECAALVNNPWATGVTWDPVSKSCWEEFGDHLIYTEVLRACIFTSGKLF